MTWVLFLMIGDKGFTVQGFETKALCVQAGEELDAGIFSSYSCKQIKLKVKE
jgi:hypothetical protein